MIYKDLKINHSSKKLLFLKLLTCFIVPNPLLEISGFDEVSVSTDIFDLTFTYRLNDIMTALMVLKFITVLPALINLSFMGDSSY